MIFSLWMSFLRLNCEFGGIRFALERQCEEIWKRREMMIHEDHQRRVFGLALVFFIFVIIMDLLSHICSFNCLLSCSYDRLLTPSWDQSLIGWFSHPFVMKTSVY